MSKNYYEILGVSKSSSAEEMRSAYRKLAMKYHPDRNKGDKASEGKFKEINEAYEVLKDPQKRSAYDHYGKDAANNMGSRTQGGFSSDGFSFNFGGDGSFSDLFEDLFSRGGGGFNKGARRSEARGADLRYDINITLEEAFNGKNIEISLKKQDVCDKCNGSGAQSGSKPEICSMCHGSGVVRVSKGFFSLESTCQKCGGSGSYTSSPCPSCGGSGCSLKSKVLSVSIPAGLQDGTRIRITGEGEAGRRGGSCGDLYVYVTISKHRLFDRNVDDLRCETPISFVTAALGGEIELPTIDGEKISIKIPQGTQSGQILKVKSKGMRRLHSVSRGDMLVTIQLETPVHLTARQKELLQEFEGACSEKSHPRWSNFWSKFKCIFL